MFSDDVDRSVSQCSLMMLIVLFLSVPSDDADRLLQSVWYEELRL